MAELAYITAKEAESLPSMFHAGRAMEFYGTSLVHAYRYLFDYQDELSLNPYDPQFRGASDLYNQSLEGLLRLVRQDGEMRPGMTRTIRTSNHTCSFEIVTAQPAAGTRTTSTTSSSSATTRSTACGTTTTTTAWACR